MRIEILLQEELQRIDEISLKHGIAHATAVGLIASSIYGNQLHNDRMAHHKAPPVVQQAQQAQQSQQSQQSQQANIKHDSHINPEHQQLVKQITHDYHVDAKLANHIVQLAFKYQDPVFPRAHDIISLIGVESSFDPNAISDLKEDPAIGLMQVRPAKWGLTASDLATPEQQIKHGVRVLSKYYHNLKGNKKAALQAYNVGLRNYKKGVKAPEYVQKFSIESQRFAANTIAPRG